MIRELPLKILVLFTAFMLGAAWAFDNHGLSIADVVRALL